MLDILVLFALGFVTFFATGIDDTVAYASSYLKDKCESHERLISAGVILGTIIALMIAIFAGTLMEAIPSRHLVGAAVLITIGILKLAQGEGYIKRIKARLSRQHDENHKQIHKVAKKSKSLGAVRFVSLGMILFFSTGIDDIIAYSNLVMAEGSWFWISAGVMVATSLALVAAHFLASRLKKLKHPQRIGAVLIIIIGVLLGLQIV